jgi:hypothetical protein
MQYEFHNYNDFIKKIYKAFLFQGLYLYYCFINQILDLLIRYLINIKDK